MSLDALKITDAAIAANGIQSAPDRLQGTAAQNKALFDRLIQACVKPLFNALIDALEARTGADCIGAEVEGLTATSVSEALAELKTAMAGTTGIIIVEKSADAAADGALVEAALADGKMVYVTYTIDNLIPIPTIYAPLTSIETTEMPEPLQDRYRFAAYLKDRNLWSTSTLSHDLFSDTWRCS